MKPEQIYQELHNLANNLGVKVSEENFRMTGIRVKSGYCKVKGEAHCIIDKHLKMHRKVEALAECLSGLNHESVYVVPAVRELLDSYTPKTTRKDTAEPTDPNDLD